MSPEIVIIAGTNGAGKSSVAGAALRQSGVDYYNPDEAARAYMAAGLTPDEANVRAWGTGLEHLKRAIDEGLDFALETTLGGRTITAVLADAMDRHHDVRVWYVGLASDDLHIQRVRERVARGGHDIPERMIRSRWKSSRKNVIRLLPRLAELSVWDNSAPRDPFAGEAPEPVRILGMKRGRIVHLCRPEDVPGWAKPIVAAAVRHDAAGRRRPPSS